MTDNEIIKALECCTKLRYDIQQPTACLNCPYYNLDDCAFELKANALDLINRQKAEVERLQKQLNNAEDLVNEKTVEITDLLGEIEKLQSRNKFLEIEMRNSSNLFDSRMAGIRAEAIKEFAERLKEKFRDCSRCEIGNYTYYMVGDLLLDNLVKEMIGE